MLTVAGKCKDGISAADINYSNHFHYCVCSAASREDAMKFPEASFTVKLHMLEGHFFCYNYLNR